MKGKITLEEYRLWVIFHLTNDLLLRAEENASTPTGITNQQFLVLWIMEFLTEVNGVPITITDLAPILHRSLNSVSLIVDRMEKTGLVKKVRDLPDRRAVRISPTKKADRIFLDSVKTNRDFIKSSFSIYTEEEQKQLLSLIRKLKNKLFKDLQLENMKSDPELNSPAQIMRFINKLYSKPATTESKPAGKSAPRTKKEGRRTGKSG
jgi:DNA-binding MarR family transcriptional regulator